MMNRVLGLFAKWPEAGAVKTRLAALRGADWAARVAEAFLRDTLMRLKTVAARRVVVFAPAEARPAFAALAGTDFALLPQSDGVLGRRLSDFLRYEQNSGSKAVVMVGTDSPTLPVAYVEHAFAELEKSEVVLGPACDGGYYLLGCSRVVPPIFDNITWGGARVLADTVAALVDPRWRLAVLPPWYDVDTPDDWAMLCGHLAALRRAGVDPGVPHTESLTRECH
jgi:rSAM/selenodomain-associated transferase 1